MKKSRSRFTVKTKEMFIEPLDEANIWEGDWVVTLRGEKDIEIGSVSFAGQKLLGAVPIRVTLMEEYQNKGYGTLVFKLMTDFAFGYKNIYEVTGVTDSDNDKCIYAMEKAGFVRRKKEGKVETYSIIKPNSVWLSLYIYLGIIAGLIIGIVIASMWVGLVIGVVIGIAFGAMMDYREKKLRREVTGNEK